MSDDLPEFVPDEYDPDAELAERLPIIAEMEGGIEIHTQGQKGVVENVRQPQHFSENGRGTQELKCGVRSDDWSYEIVVPGSEDAEPFLRSVDPNQPHDAYLATRRTIQRDIDVRVYGVDTDRFDDDVQTEVSP